MHKRMGPMDWTLIQTLLAVEQTGSFTSGAILLGVHQSTVTRRMAELESQVGEPLFDRTQHPLNLTDRGRSLADAARPMQTAAVAAETALHEESGVSGLVRIAAATEFLDPLVRALPTLRRRHPLVQVQITVGTRVLSLAAGEADLALRPRPSEGADLVARRVATVEFGLFRASSLGMHARMPILGFTTDLAHAPESRWLQEAIPDGVWVLRVDDTQAIAAAAAAGVGLALLPLRVARRHPSLERVPSLEATGPDLPTREIWIVLHRHRRWVPRVRAVAGWVGDALTHAKITTP